MERCEAKAKSWWLQRRTVVASVIIVVAMSGAILASNQLRGLIFFQNQNGVTATMSTTGQVTNTGAFFQSLGTNGRSCVTCHQPSNNWTVTPTNIQFRFLTTLGTDPIFRPVDGANCPSADVSNVWQRAKSYSTLLSKGLIRISLPVPSNAEFTIVNIDDPYSCAETTKAQPAFYRRPLPSTNLFLSTVMWDGRESAPAAPTPKPATIDAALHQQVIDATTGHAQAALPPSTDQVNDIVAFEEAIFSAQMFSNKAGDLTDAGAQGGPVALSAQTFSIGINDSLTPGAFDPKVFTIFEPWANLAGTDGVSAMRQSIARGEALFNTKPITITGVGGLNLNPNVVGASFTGTCTTCHDSPNVGDHSMSLPLNIGVSDASRRTPDLPLYTLQCNSGPLAGQTVQTTDIGRAMISGKCADIGKVKGPVLRGLAARAPYFHNGSAATLMDAVTFYDQRFGIGFTDQEKADLVAFLNSL